MMGEALKIPARDVTVAKFLGRIDGSSFSSLLSSTFKNVAFIFWSINHSCLDGRRGVSVLCNANTVHASPKLIPSCWKGRACVESILFSSL
jgi:hypothetical protein